MRAIPALLFTVVLAACSDTDTDTSADVDKQLQASESPALAAAENEEAPTLESAVDEGGLDALIAQAYQHAQATVAQTDLQTINSELRPHDRIFRPEGDGPFPAVLFFHGCSGATPSHEEDWAAFYNSIGVMMIAVDSYSGRDIDWEQACNMQVMTPWQRAADVLATIAYARELPEVDADKLILSGFSHGAITVWQTLVFGSGAVAPISLQNWPENGLEGVRLAFPFYGTCMGRWTVDIPTTMFLGAEDRYIDEQSCIDYVDANPDLSELFQYRLFEGATHTFDHARPNQSNIDAGSVYDAAATEEAMATIASAISGLTKE